jgi:hypothetical protein
MVTVGATHRSATVKDVEKSVVSWSGGSLLSWSLTPVAATVRVHDSVSARLVAGSTVKVVGPRSP